MDKYEYHLKVDQIEKLMKKKDYETASQIADTIDWRRVKDLNVLYVVSEVYEKTKRYEDCMEILSIAYDRAPVGRLVLYKMTEIAIKMGDLEEARALYQDFVKVAPHDQSRFILKYQIYRDRGSSLEDQIKILKEYKTHEYQEKWAYELASLYAQAGMERECVQECDELILWFSEGEYVAKALELKQQYEPLTASQQMKYQQEQNRAIQGKISLEETEVPAFDEDKFNTTNLQAELAANVGELLLEDATIEIPDLVQEKKPGDMTSEIELEELVFPGEMKAKEQIWGTEEPAPVPEDKPKFILEEIALPEEKPELVIEDFPPLGEEEPEAEEEPELVIKDFPPLEGEAPEVKEEPELVIEDFPSLREEEAEEEAELVIEDFPPLGEEEPEAEKEPELVIEDFPPLEGEAPEVKEEPELVIEDFPSLREEEAEEEAELVIEDFPPLGEEEPEAEKEPELVIEDFLSLREEEAEEEAELVIKDFPPLEEEEPEAEEKAELVIEDFPSLEEEELEAEEESELVIEDFPSLGEEEPEAEEESELVIEDFPSLEEEEPEAKEESELTIEDFSPLGEESKPEEELTPDFEGTPFLDDDIASADDAGQPEENETIHGILAKWEDKIAETEAVLEATAKQEQKRKEKVKQETVELMKLISGISEEIPKDVRQILEEMDEEQKSKEKSPVERPEQNQKPEKEEEELSIEELVPEPTLLKREKLSGDTASMNMIQELERALSVEMSQKAVEEGHLTVEQVRLFDYFTSVRGMSEQLSLLLKGDSRKGMTTSSSGNLVITGEPGNGKTTLAIDIVKALQKQNWIAGSKLAKITGKKLNTKDIYEVFSNLKSGALIIERAGEVSDATMMALSLTMETDTGGLLVILEDTAEEIERLFRKNKNFASKFEYTIDIPVFTNDELVAFGKSYALEQEYTFDEFALLALYGEIGSRQTNDHLVTVAEVKDIIDAAIERAGKGSIRHLIERVTKKSQDEYGNKLLRESDFVD